MTAPRCPEHPDLMLDLARGLLGDAEAAVAEDLRESCGRCEAWWDETFSGPAVEKVESAVAEVFAGFSAPARSRRPWLAAAAAAVLVVGMGVVTMMWRSGEPAAAGAGRTTAPDAVLTVWDFEDQAVVARPDEPAQTPMVSPADQEAVFSSDLESGDLGGWTVSS